MIRSNPRARIVQLAMWAIVFLAGPVVRADTFEEGELASKLVPSPVAYTVLLPSGYATSDKAYPLFIFLHGGNGDDGFLRNVAGAFREAWAAGESPEMVVATPSCGRGFYMDYRDGSEKWEAFLMDEFLPSMREKYRVSPERADTYIGGVSMGGMGSLRAAFKNPDRFHAVVSFEPGIEPSFEWKDVTLEDKFWRAPELLEEIYGSPIDEAYWARNNPATLARDYAGVLRGSGLAVYIEAGTRDSFGLDRGTDFLHRVLYDNRIEHEYRLVYGADHVGRSMLPRIRNGLGFIGRLRNAPKLDPQADALHVLIRRWKDQAGLEE
jgi:S-formylglutathione hydrolase